MAFAGDNQSAPVGSPVSVAPAVKVTDADGSPVAGARVVFNVTSGGGIALGASQITDANGIATLTRWTLGSFVGPHTLRASLPIVAGAEVTFTAIAEGSLFDIELVFRTTVTQAQRNAFTAAVARWRRAITGDIGTVNVQTAGNSCNPAIHEEINDLRIYVEIEPIDGPGDVLGAAGPCLLRNGSLLPVVGLMRFDSEDLEFLESNGRLTDVILHEMGHVLGIGTLWDPGLKDLLVGGGTSDPYFTGREAVERFNAIGGSAYQGNKVPVEHTGGEGTADSHWRESIFESELMTGFLERTGNPMSVVTIGSLRDIGYVVNYGEADDYTWSPAPALRADRLPKIPMHRDVLPFRPHVLP